MVGKKPRIVIIGAGMAGLTAANKLYKSANSKEAFELTVVEGGSRIGGRINSSEFCGDGIELGATWIHGIEGSPVHEIAQNLSLLQSEKPWECMGGVREDPLTIAEGGHFVNPCFVEPVSRLFENLMNFIQGKAVDDEIGVNLETMKRLSLELGVENRTLGVGDFLRRGLEAYWEAKGEQEEVRGMGNWNRTRLEEGIFAMNESIQRTYTSADDLGTLDYSAEKEYVMFPGEEITIAKGYSSVVESLASVLPQGMIQLGRKVDRIQWHPSGRTSNGFHLENNGHQNRPVVLHFSDGSTVSADHVIVTVSLGVLKRGLNQDCAFFDPPLPSVKRGAISRLGYGLVNKVFLQMCPDEQESDIPKFPYLQMVFHKQDSELRNLKIPDWIRKTSFVHPIYRGSRVLLSWFTGQDALDLETLPEEEIVRGFSATVSNLLPAKSHSQKKPTFCNGNDSNFPTAGEQLKFGNVLRSQWGSDPLFLGSYSYIAVGSSVDDMDTLAEPLPQSSSSSSSLGSTSPQLQILFAGEATHRTHYSTTHGAYFSGLREANRLLKHYNCITGV